MASRHRNTYWTRVGVSVVGLCIFVGLGLLAAEMQAPDQGRLLFTLLANLAFVYCVFVGASATADCLSEEKREGTLGLLFLTDLKGYDVVLGKLAASSLRSIYGLLAVVPILSLAILLGGVSGGEVFRMAVILVNTLFLSLASGIFASTISRNERKAIFATIALIAFLSLGPGAAIFGLVTALGPTFINSLGGPRLILLIPSPVISFQLCLTDSFGGILWRWELVCSQLAIHLMGWSLLGLSSLLLPRVCKDRPKTGRRLRWWERWQRWTYGNAQTRSTVRTSLLDKNPFMWLAGRERLKMRLVWGFLGALFVIWIPARFDSADTSILGAIFLLFCAHVVLKLWLVSEVCSRWVEDRHSGALELLLSSPISVAEIARGQTLALRSQFAKVVFVVLALDALLLWYLKFSYFDPNASRLIAMIPAGMIALIADLVALRWVAMWLALTSKSMVQALMGAWIRVLALPWLIHLACYWGVAFFWPLPRRSEAEIPAALWAAGWLATGLIVDGLFAQQAKQNFLNELRSLASEQFSPKKTKSAFQAIISFAKSFLERRPKQIISQAQSRPRFQWRRHAWASGLIGLIVFGVGWLAWQRFTLSRQIKAELLAAQRAGFPVTEDDLEKWRPSIPSQRNFAAVVALATPQILNAQWLARPFQTNLPGISRSDWPSRTSSLPAQMKEAISLFVSTNRKVLNLVTEATDYGQSRYDAAWSRSQNFWWGGPFSGTREIIQLLQLETALQIDDGPPENALKSLNTLLAVSRSLAQEPVLHLNGLRNMSMNRVSLTLERLLTRYALSAQRLKELADRVDGLETTNGLVRALAGHRYLRIPLFQWSSQRLVALWSPGLSKWQTIGFGMLLRLHSGAGMRDRDFLTFLQTMKKYIEAARLPFPELLTKAIQFTQPNRDQSQIPYDLTSHVLPDFPGYVALEADMEARLSTVRTGLAIERYRTQHQNRLPETLKQIVPEYLKNLPLDPFDGKPLRYKRLTKGFVVYSIGRDLKDDGGQESQGSVRKSNDITFIVER